MFARFLHLISRVGALLRPRPLDRDFDEELDSHLSMLAEDYISRGMSPEEARRAARVALGGPTQLREAHRARRGLPLVETFLQDVCYAIRALRQNPGFTATAVLTLAFGIGVNTAAFTAYNAIALRPLQAKDPSRLVQVVHGNRDNAFSYPDYVWYRDHSRTFSGLAAMTSNVFSMSGAGIGVSGATPDTGGIVSAVGLQLPRVLAGGSEPVTAIVVSGNYFQVLGIEAAVGRTFLPEEDSPASQPVVLISYNFWKRRFSGDPGLVGRSLKLNGIDVTVTGIAPPDFTGTWATVPDLWVPIGLEPRLASRPKMLDERANRCCRVYGRLQTGVAQAQAEEEVSALAQVFQTEFPIRDGAARRDDGRMALGLANTSGNITENSAQPLFLLAAVGLVLLIACANVASLLLARSAARQREIAIRLAIGASRGRVIRQLLTENAVMCVIAGGLGTILSWWALRILVVQLAASPLGTLGTLVLHVAPDQRVLGYMLLLAAGSTFAFGLAPALEASRPNLGSGLKDEGAAFAGPLRKSRLRDLMVGGQVAICLVLLVAAGLLAHSSRQALEIDLGFDYRKIVSLEVVFPPATSIAELAATRGQLAHELEALPEIESVAVSSHLPLVHGGLMGAPAILPPIGPEVPVLYTLVTSSYFPTMKTPILRGRNFLPGEVSDGVNLEGVSTVVSQATAKRLWPGEDALGKRFVLRRSLEGEPPRNLSGVVVGIAGDVRSVNLIRIDETCLYFPVTAAYGDAGSPGRPSSVFVMRARSGEARAVAAIERTLRAAHGDLQATVGDSRSAYTNQTWFVASRLGAIVAAIVGALGLLMASVGIYGTVGFAVTQRTQEIGIRMALGAGRRNVVRLVLAETMRPVTVGLASGLALAAILSRLMVSSLFGLSALDPLAFLGASGFLLGVAFLAAYFPARRATTVDPMTALRHQ